MRILSLFFVFLSTGHGATIPTPVVPAYTATAPTTLHAQTSAPALSPSTQTPAATTFQLTQTPAATRSLPASSGGIYLTAEHFNQRTLSYPFDCQTSKLKLNNFLSSPNIRIVRNGEKYTILKDTIFGYRDCGGINYRFYKKGPYRILDTAGFYLYSYAALQQGDKIARPATAYYFSTQPAAPILPLTISNLQKAFASNSAFCYKLSAEFRSDAALTDWFAAGNTYKLKYAYTQTLK